MANQILFNDNFDGAQFVVPNPPSEWIFQQFVTTTAQKRSGVNGVAAVSNAGAIPLAIPKSFDLNSGNVVSSLWVYMDAGSNGVNKWVYARGLFPSTGGTPGLSWDGSQTCYYTQVQKSGTAGASVVQLHKVVAGTDTTLGVSLAGDMFSVAGWYQIAVLCNGTTISSQVRRDSDGYYLTAAGTYQVAAATVQSVTDGAIAGAGGYGFGAYNNGGSTIYADDYELDSAAPLAAAGLTILAIGDSITAGVITGAQNGPLVAMASNLATLHGARTVQIINQGRGGAQTSQYQPGSALMTQAMTAAGSYTFTGQKWAIVNLGVNDSNSATYMPQATYQANLAAICAYLVGQGYKVILNVPSFVVAGSYSGLFTATSQTLLKSYQDAIIATKDDLNTFLGDTGSYDVLSNNAAKLSDGVHPTSSGSVDLGNLWAQGAYRAIYLNSGFTAALASAGLHSVTPSVLKQSDTLARIAATGADAPNHYKVP